MDSKDIRKLVRAFVETNLARDHRDVDLDTESLVDTGIIDSLGIVKLVEHLEEKLGVKLPDEELLPETFDTLDTITTFLAAKLHR